MALAWILACAPADTSSTPVTDTASPTGPTVTEPPTVPSTPPTTPDPPPPPIEPVLLACGGGTEGDVGDTTSWSTAYGELLSAGDVTGDGLVRVAVLSVATETTWLPEYLEWLGADEAFNLRVQTRAEADAVDLSDIDAVFIKGGDQGEYYDRWNDTALDAAILDVHARGGGVGGTSAGAMSLSEYALAGGMDLIASDPLLDAHTPYLDDASDGGSGIHDNFFGLIPGAVVDTHFSVRGRLARLAGVLAKAIDDGGPPDLLGMGIDEQTCVVIRGQRAEVVGVGSVAFLLPGDEPPLRIPGEPLVWAGLSLDRLTAGWAYDLQAHATDTLSPPAAAEAVAWDGFDVPPTTSNWVIDGFEVADERSFAWRIERAPDAFGLVPGDRDPLMSETVGIVDAFSAEVRGLADESMFRALHDDLGLTGFLVGDSAWLTRPDGAGTVVTLAGRAVDPMATVVLDPHAVTWRSLSPVPSVQDAGDGSLHAAGLVGLTVHVLYTDGPDARAYDVASREPVPR